MGLPTPRFSLPRRSREDSFLPAKDLSDLADRLEVVLGTAVDMTVGRLKDVSDAVKAATNLPDPGQLVRRAPSGTFGTANAFSDEHATAWGQVKDAVDKIARASSASSGSEGRVVIRDPAGLFGVFPAALSSHPARLDQVQDAIDVAAGTRRFPVLKPTLNEHPADFHQFRVGPLIQRAADGNYWSDGELRFQRVGWTVYWSFRGIARSNGFYPLGNIPDVYLPTFEARYPAAIPGQNGDFRMENNAGVVRMSALAGQATQTTGSWPAARARTDI